MLLAGSGRPGQSAARNAPGFHGPRSVGEAPRRGRWVCLAMAVRAKYAPREENSSLPAVSARPAVRLWLTIAGLPLVFS